MSHDPWSKRAQLRRRMSRRARRAAGKVRAALGGEPAHLPPEENEDYIAETLATAWSVVLGEVPPVDRISVGDQEFVSLPVGNIRDLGLAPEELVIYKSRAMIDRYLELRDADSYERVVELGILRGGSTAFMFQAFQPKTLAAFDIISEPQVAIERFIDDRGLRDRIHLHYGIDQVDVGRMLPLVREAMDSKPLDLVVDDASHLYAPTRASFGALFPLLREGGLYVIEDWQWAHVPGYQDYDPGKPAMTNLIVEIILLAGTRPDIVREVRVRRYMVEIVRGETPVESPMDMATLTINRGNPYRPVI